MVIRCLSQRKDLIVFDGPQELVYLLCSACIVPNQARLQFCSNLPHLLLWKGNGEGYSLCLDSTGQMKSL
ncbi:hypothetical protein Q8A67_011808 [Cirrhinus molitorella]|uniref:Uncharacterized protein n=1 Tax=Cirrhinus molitorella TaxID=172907 RepID=A0AA88PL83_9TELE|nr:hypothetical protein Q8A67_011808 [Cirrhinus molitorella]